MCKQIDMTQRYIYVILLSVQQALISDVEGFSGTIWKLDKLNDALQDAINGLSIRDADEPGLVETFKYTTSDLAASGECMLTIGNKGLRLYK